MNCQLVEFSPQEANGYAALFSQAFPTVPKNYIKTSCRMINLLIATRTLPRSFIDGPKGKEKALLQVCHGKKIGLDFMESLNGLYVIDSRISLYVETMKTLALRSGLVVQLNSHFDDETQTASCTVQRKGIDDPTTFKMTMADAAKAGLTNRSIWKKWPKIMLINRVVGFALRMQFPDLFHGVKDDPDGEISKMKEAQLMPLVDEKDAEKSHVMDEELGNLLAQSEIEVRQPAVIIEKREGETNVN